MAVAKSVSTIPSGSNTRSRRKTSSGRCDAARRRARRARRHRCGTATVRRAGRAGGASTAGASIRRAPAAPAVPAHPRPDRARPSPRGAAGATARSKSAPSPRRKVRRSRTVIGRCAGTVSPSIGPLGSTMTRRLASSGSRSSTGSSARSRHSSMRISAPTATIGFVIDAMRKMVSRRTGSRSPRVSVPLTPISTSSSRATSHATPPMVSSCTWPAMTSCSRLNCSRSNPLMLVLTLPAVGTHRGPPQAGCRPPRLIPGEARRENSAPAGGASARARSSRDTNVSTTLAFADGHHLANRVRLRWPSECDREVR